MKDNPKILDDLAGYVDATKNSDGDAVLASKWVNTPNGDVRYDLTLGMVRRMHAENATMRVSLNASIKILRPVWDALLAHIVPIWKMIEPILETADGHQPQPDKASLKYADVPYHGDIAKCSVCGGEIEYVEETTANDVINAWWAHVVHPANGHDAQPDGAAVWSCTVCGSGIERIDPRDGLPGVWRHIDPTAHSDHDASAPS